MTRSPSRRTRRPKTGVSRAHAGATNCRVSIPRPRTILVLIFFAALLVPTAVRGAQEEVRELRLPSVLVETEPKPDLGFEVPPSAYPLHPVEQLPFHGVRHGFVTTTTGGLVFKMWDMKLPGRMPIEMGRVYDSKLSVSMPPPPPKQSFESRWTQDLGDNWILAYSSYFIVTGMSTLSMQLPNGDIVKWIDQGTGYYERALDYDCPMDFMSLEDGASGELVATQLDGTRWIYTAGVMLGVSHGLTKIEDLNGNHIDLTYSNGYLSMIANSDGAFVSVVRAQDNPPRPAPLWPLCRVVKLEDHTGREVLFDYDSDGLLTDATDVTGHSWTFAYDPTRKLASATDPLGNVFLTASHDAATHKILSVEADAGAWSFDYSTQYTTKATDALGSEWSYSHTSESGITTQITEPTGGVHQLTIDGYNNPDSYQGPEGISATWTYNSLHQPTSYTPPGITGNSISYSYDVDDYWVDSITSLDGGTTSFVRDAAGRVTEETQPDGGKWTATYGSYGDRLTLRLPEGSKPGGSGYLWQFGYDSFGNVATAEDPAGRVFEFDYTAHGDLWKVRRPDHLDQGQVVHAEWVYGRDSFGRLTSATDSLGNTWARTHDNAGRLVSVVGPAGSEWRYVYDDHYRLTEVTRENGDSDLITTLGYDVAGRLRSKSLQTGAAWLYDYDGSARLTGVTDPLGRNWSYTRNLAGAITVIQYPGGRQVSITRDTAGRVIEKDLPGGAVENINWDAMTGRLSNAELIESGGSWTGGLTWTYDSMGRPSSLMTSVHDGTLRTQTLSFAYDLNGNRDQLAVSGGETIDYTYDELDRLVLADSDTYEDWVVQYDYGDPTILAGHRTRVQAGTAPDERWEEWDYDLEGRITGHRWEWPNQDSGQFTMTHDVEGRVLSAVDVSAGITGQVQLNLLGAPVQLEEIEGGQSTTTSYAYDGVGNPVEMIRTVGTEPSETSVFDWDDAGRMLYARQGTHIRTYEWEDAPTAEDAVLAVWRGTSTTSEPTAEVQYGPYGRLKRIVSHSIYNEDPIQQLEMRWAPLLADRALEIIRPDAAGGDSVTRMVSDLNGYYGQMTEEYVGEALVSPISGVLQSDQLVGASLGNTVPRVQAPFWRGAWSGDQESNWRGDFGALADFATGVGRGRSDIDTVMNQERREDLHIGTIGRLDPVLSDFVDDWTGGRLLANAEGESLGADAEPSVGLPGPISMTTAACSAPGCRGGDGIQVAAHDFECVDGYIVELGLAGGGLGRCMWTITGGGPSPEECFYEFPIEFPPDYVPTPQRQGDMSEGGVSLVNGDFVHEVVDLSVFDAAGNVEFRRTYRSGISKDGDLGYKWYHNWDEFVVFGEDSSDPDCGTLARWVQADGSFVDFLIDSEGNVELPPDSLYKFQQNSATTYDLSIRHISGVEKRFEESGDRYRLVSIVSGGSALYLDYGGNDQLTGVRSGSNTRLEFDYYPDGRLKEVVNAIDSTEKVEFSYNDCGELEWVKYPQADLGFDKLGQPYGSTPQPTTYYTYGNINPNDCNTVEAGHRLTRIEVQQVNPLTGVQRVETVLQNRYLGTVIGANDPDFINVSGQCFGHEVCDGGGCTPKECTSDEEADIQYVYETGVENYGLVTTMIDRRVAGETIQERHAFGAWGLLEEVIEDYGEGGLNRTTTYEYNSERIVEKTTFADGTCELAEYQDVAGIYVPTETRFRVKERCDGGGSGPPDLVTVQTYEPFNGGVRTVTAPEAFSDGTVPANFDPYTDPWRAYTTIYDYDFHQTDQGQAHPQGVQDVCEQWGLCDCDSSGICEIDRLGDINSAVDGADPENEDRHWFGNVIRNRRWVPGDGVRTAGYLTTLKAYQNRVRLSKETRQLQDDQGAVLDQGVSTSYDYYTEAAQGNWDWRESHGVLATGSGPLAAITLISSDSQIQPLTSYFAWSEKNSLIAKQDPKGLREEREVAVAGWLLEKEIVCDPAAGTGCMSPGTSLSTTQYSYDLRGRLVRETVLDSGGAVLSSSWFTHDDLGRLTTSTVNPNPSVTPGDADPDTTDDYLHLRTRLFFDGRSRTAMAVSPAGRVVCSHYDNLDRTTRTIRLGDYYSEATTCPQAPGGGDIGTSAIHDALDRPVAVTDARGHTTYQWYDAYGRPEYVADGEPSETVTNPVCLGTAQATPSPAHWFSKTEYDSRGRVARHRFYGRDGRSSEAGNLRVSWREYDDLGRISAVHLGIAEKQPYVPVDALATADLAPPDALAIVGFDLATVTTAYDELGRKCQTIDDDDRVTEYEYDGFGRPDRVLFPEHSTDEGLKQDRVEREYDDFGRISSIATIYHDPTGNPHQRLSTTYYDPWSRVRTSNLGVGDGDSIETINYDALGRTTRRIRRWQDLGEEVYLSVDSNDRVTESLYDGAGRLAQVRIRASTDPVVFDTTSFVYDEDGYSVSMEDALGNVTAYEVDALGRIGKQLYPTQDGRRQAIVYEQYDKNGNAEVVKFKSDDEPDVPTITWTMTYDDHNRVKTRGATVADSPLHTFLGTEAQSFSYDDLGRLTIANDESGTDFPGEEIKVEVRYDTAGRAFEEDQLAHLNGASITRTIERAFATGGFLTSLRFPNAHDAVGNTLGHYEIQYTPDDLGRLSVISGPDVLQDFSSGHGWRALATYEYMGSRVWSRAYDNDTITRFNELQGSNFVPLYDGLGRNTGRKAHIEIMGPDLMITSFRYGYDRVGNRTYEQRNHEHLGADRRTRAFNSDLRNRLVKWVEGRMDPANPVPPDSVHPTDYVSSMTDAEEWSLDALGNWDFRKYGVGLDEETDDYRGDSTSENANRLNQYEKITPDGGTELAFVHDWLGQLREDPSKPTSQEYVWDAFGRLTQVKNAVTGSVIATYRYDALNRRVEKILGSLSTPDARMRFIYDGWRAIEEREVIQHGGTSREVVRARYGFGLGLDEVLWMDRDVARSDIDSDGEFEPDPISGLPDNVIEARYFVHHDALGSAVAITNDPDTDSSGATEVVERFTYSAYGQVSAWWNPAWMSGGYNGPASAMSKVGLPYLYTGQRHDRENHLHYFKSRFYDPHHGRFLKRDSLGYIDGPSLYQYGQSQPQLARDPLGFRSWTDEEVGIHNWMRGGEARRAGNNAYVGLSVQFRNVSAYLDHKRTTPVGWGPTKLQFYDDLWVPGQPTIDASGAASSEVVKSGVLGLPLGQCRPIEDDPTENDRPWLEPGDEYFAEHSGIWLSVFFVNIEVSCPVSQGGCDPADWLKNVGTAGRLTFKFFSGLGDDEDTFANDRVANSLKNATVVEEARAKWYDWVNNCGLPLNGSVDDYTGVDQYGVRGRGNFGPSEVIRAGLDPIEQAVGSMSVSVIGDGESLTFRIENTTSLTSASYGLLPSYDRSESLPVTPGGNVTQVFEFTEPIDQRRLRRP